LDLATRYATQAASQYPDSAAVAEVHRAVLSQQRQKYQEFDPFRFIVYSEAMKSPVPAIHAPGSHSSN
jgi:hypothetical protein